MERIKGIRQKTGAGQYSNFVPFGSDGQLIDMASELNLEYELKLGSKHITRITNADGIIKTQIIEYYATPEELETSGSNFYSVETLIYENNTIKIKLYWITTSLQNNEIIYNKKFIKGKTITIEEQPSSQGGNTNFNITETYFDEEE